MKNSSIDFKKDTGIVYVCKDSIVYVYSAEMKIIDEISLDISILENEEATYFRFCEVNKTFHVIVGYKVHRRISSGYSEGTYYYKFKDNGDFISRIALTQDTIILNQNSDNSFDLLYNSDSWGMHHFYEGDWKIVPKDRDSNWVDLSLEYVQESENVPYEYITFPVSTNRPNQFAFIATHANYGSQGVQIVNLNQLNKLEIVYEILDTEEDGLFRYLTFNPTGDKFAFLLLDYRKNTCSILEYSTKDNSRPLQWFKADFNVKRELTNLDNVENTHYLNENLLGIVKYGSIVVFNLELGQSEEVLKRDINSPYKLNTNSILYYHEGELILREY